MKFILTRLRYGINKVFYKQRAVLPNQAKHRLNNNNNRNQLQNDFDSTAGFNKIFGKFMTSASRYTGLKGLSSETAVASQTHFQTRGLLDLVKADHVGNEIVEGDFARINPENFAHALNYSKIDLEMANFRLDEIQTTVSQALDNISFMEETGNLYESGSIDSNRTITSNTTQSNIDTIPLEEVIRDSILNHGRETIFRPML